MFDNRVFDVNGKDQKTLTATIDLAVTLSGSKVRGWKIDPDKGIILLWSNSGKDAHPFPTDISTLFVAGIVWDWLQSEEAKKIKLQNWDIDHQHDGSNGKGWRVYCEGWGHVGDEHYSIVAITPAYLWYGK